MPDTTSKVEEREREIERGGEQQQIRRLSHDATLAQFAIMIYDFF